VVAGVYGWDGAPVAAGAYTFPGGQLTTDGRTGPAEIVGPRDCDIILGETFFVISTIHPGLVSRRPGV